MAFMSDISAQQYSTAASLSSPPAEAAPPLVALASDVQRVVLDNGLSILVKEVYPAKVVSLALWVRAGSTDETDAETGMSHFLEHMLFKGTPTRPVGTIAQQVHGLGGHMNAFTSYDCTCYWMVVPSRHIDVAVDIHVDSLLNSLLEADEIEREAEVILEEMRMYQDRPASLCNEKLMALMFPQSPYGRPIIGSEAGIRRVDREGLSAYYQRMYRPANLSCVVVGDVRSAEVVQLLADKLGSVPAGRVTPRASLCEAPQTALRRTAMLGPIRSSHLQIGYRVPSILSDETYGCDLLSSILGGGRSSRLYQSLRERQGLVTQVNCSVSAEKDEGMLIVEAVHGDGQTEAVLDAVFAEVEAMRDAAVSEAELQKAKNMVEASYVFSQETVEGQGRKLGYGEMLGDHTLAERYVHKLYAVSADDVLVRAGRYLTRDNCSIVSYTAEPS
jgi:zinc protease